MLFDVDKVRRITGVIETNLTLDDWQIYDILQKELGDFRLFIADAWRIVREKGDKTGKAS
jgi:hypothetical protein